MRSTDFKNKKRTFSRLSPKEMIRVALINGLNENINPDTDIYKRAVKHFTDPGKHHRVDKLSSIISEDEITVKQEAFLKDLLKQFDYQSPIWKNLNYQALEFAGIIRPVDELSDLVEESLVDEPHVVYALRGEGLGYKKYLKHIHPRNKLRLDSKEVIQRFAEIKGFNLPEQYLKSGKLTREVRGLLELHNFTYLVALETGFGTLQREENQNRLYTTLSFRNPSNGDEVRFHLHDYLEGFSRNVHRKLITEEEIEFEFKSKLNESTGYVRDRAYVPKRIPEENRNDFNTVEAHLMPSFSSSRLSTNWWDTISSCDCKYAFNLRNFMQRVGKSVREVHTADIHFIDYFLDVFSDGREVTVWGSPTSLVPIATPELISVADRFLYNSFLEIPDEEGKAPTRRTHKEIEIESALFELGKQKPFGFMFRQPDKIGTFIREYSYVLQPMYHMPELRK